QVQLFAVQLVGSFSVTAVTMPSMMAAPPLKVAATPTVRSKKGEWSPAATGWVIWSPDEADPLLGELGAPRATPPLVGSASRDLSLNDSDPPQATAAARKSVERFRICFTPFGGETPGPQLWTQPSGRNGKSMPSSRNVSIF